MAAPLELRPRVRIRNHLLTGLEDAGRPGEVVAVHHHPAAYSRGVAWLLGAVALWALFFRVDAPGETIWLVLLVALRGGWLVLQTYEDWFVVTNRRIFRIQGVFNQQLAAMPLSRIVDVTLQEPFWGRYALWGGYGHLVFENAGQEQGLREIRHVPDAKNLNDLIQGRAFRSAPARPARGGPPGPSPDDRPDRPDRSDMDKTGEIPRVT